MTINKFITKEYLNSSIQYENPLIKFDSKILPYLLNKEKDEPIFNLIKTSKFLKLAGNILQKQAEKGYKFLFVGTDPLISSILVEESIISKNYYINSRWLGGMLTNWQILQKRINKLIFLENLDKKNLSISIKKKKLIC